VLLIGGGCGGDGRRSASAPPELARAPERASGAASREIVFAHLSPGSRNAHLFVARADGSRLRRIDRTDDEKQDPEVSPDGSKVAYRSLARGDYTDTPLLVLNVRTGRATSLTKRSRVRGFGPTWRPDGRMLAVAGKRARTDNEGLWLMRPDGSSARRARLPRFEVQYPAWAPDGRSIAFTAVEQKGFAIYTAAPDGTGLKRLTPLGGSANTPSWSPDGRQIAYGEGEAGIFVMNRDGSRKRRVRRDGGSPLTWAPGPSILYSCRRGARFATCGGLPDGSREELLGGLDSGFAAWRSDPRP